MQTKESDSICLKITLIENKSSLAPDFANNRKYIYPTKLVVVIKNDLTISDLCLQIEQNVQSMGCQYLHIQSISTNDMFILSPKLILNETISNNSELVATYDIQHTNNPRNLKLIIQNWKHDIINNMSQYQAMTKYDPEEIEEAVLNIHQHKTNINMDDLMLYTLFLCTSKIESKAAQIAYCIVIVIIDKHFWTSHNKTTIEFILHELVCSAFISDDQRMHLLNICNDTMLTLDTETVVSKLRNADKIITSVLHNALSSGNIDSNATNTFRSIIKKLKDILKYQDILQCCHNVISHHYGYISTNRNLDESELSDGYKQAISNVNYMANILISTLVDKLESLLFGDCNCLHNEKEIHDFLDLMSNDIIWRQFRVIVTGIDIIWKHLTRIVSPSLNNNNNILSNNCTIIIRLRVHLLSVMFLLLETWQINNTNIYFNLLQEFVLIWINNTSDAVEFCQIIANKHIGNVISWPIEIQQAYFTKILVTDFLHQTYKSIDSALEIIKYIINYPILVNDDRTAEICESGTANSTQINFTLKKIYLQMVQKGLKEPQQKSKIISKFSGALLKRLRFATYSNEQVLLLRLLCLFHKNCKNAFIKDKIIRNVKDIDENGKLANLTTQSYVDLLLQSESNTETVTREVSATGSRRSSVSKSKVK